MPIDTFVVSGVRNLPPQNYLYAAKLQCSNLVDIKNNFFHLCLQFRKGPSPIFFLGGGDIVKAKKIV